MKRLRDALRGDGLCLTAELNLRELRGAQALQDQARALCEYVDAVHLADVNDFSAFALASLLLEAGVDPILQLFAGKKSPAAIETELLGALSMGVTSLLLVRGDTGGRKSRDQVSARQMIALADEMREDRPSFDYMIGTVARVFKPVAGWHPKSLLEKTDAGANFIRTQLCFDSTQLADYVQHLVRAQVTWQASLIVGLAVLPSSKGAKWLKENMKGTKVPESMVRRLEQARDPELEGVQIAAELLSEFKQIPGVAGVCVMSPGPDHLIAEAIKVSEVATGNDR